MKINNATVSMIKNGDTVILDGYRDDTGKIVGEAQMLFDVTVDHARSTGITQLREGEQGTPVLTFPRRSCMIIRH